MLPPGLIAAAEIVLPGMDESFCCDPSHFTTTGDEKGDFLAASQRPENILPVNNINNFNDKNLQ